MRWIALCLLTTVSPAWGQQLSERTDPRIETIVAPLVHRVTPGLAVLVMHRGNVVHARAYGLRDVDTRAPFTITTPFYIASQAKMFTALGALELAEEGKLELDTPIVELLPSAPAYAKAVTIRQLLNHTSGLIDHYDVAGEGRTYTTAAVLQILDSANGLKFPPGTKTAYSNSAYVLLALLIEQISQQRFQHFVDDRFFKPAAMRGAAVVTQPAEFPVNRARGYAHQKGGFVLYDYAAGNAPGPGAMYASLEDLYQWARALRSGSIVTPAVLKTASTPTVLSSGRDTEWGMGWLAEFHGKKDPLSGKTYVAAVGSLRGFRSLFKWYQQDDLVIVWLANTDDSQVFTQLEKIPSIMLLH